MSPVEKCLRGSGIDWRNVLDVVLVGGSTRDFSGVFPTGMNPTP